VGTISAPPKSAGKWYWAVEHITREKVELDNIRTVGRWVVSVRWRSDRISTF